MQEVEIIPKGPYTYFIKARDAPPIVINPTVETLENLDKNIEMTLIITNEKSIEAANKISKAPIITLEEHAKKIRNKERLIELREEERHWINPETTLTLLKNGNIYIKISTIEIIYLQTPPQEGEETIYTDITLLTPSVRKQHLIQANIHPQIIVSPNSKPIKVKRHLASLHITEKHENKSR